MGGTLYGKIIIEGRIKLETGLHIGTQRETAEIGGVDNPVIKDPATGLPYIPGSSLKGKLRSLFEKVKNAEQPEDKRGFGEDKFLNRNVGRAGHPIWIHVCENKENAEKCEICRLFGSSGNTNFPSRVIFEDAFPTEEWRGKTEEIIEIKYETAIDRITAAANPRPVERVVPGVEFAFRIIYNVENQDDKKTDIENLLKLLKLLEDDYLGGCGSRGYGRVKIFIDRISERTKDFYFDKDNEKVIVEGEKSVSDILDNMENILGAST